MAAVVDDHLLPRVLDGLLQVLQGILQTLLGLIGVFLAQSVL